MEFNVQVRNSQFEKSLLNKVARVANSLERKVEKELKDSFGLSFSQFRVLNGLLALGEASQRELANSLEVTPAVVTRQAEALGSRGMVAQRANPLSKREKVLALTKKGEAAAHDAAKVIAEGEVWLKGLLLAQDETAFKQGVDALVKALDKVEVEAKARVDDKS